MKRHLLDLKQAAWSREIQREIWAGKSVDVGVGYLPFCGERQLFRPLEESESAQDPLTPNPVTHTKPQRNAGACHYNPDAENLECQRQIAFVRNACKH